MVGSDVQGAGGHQLEETRSVNVTTGHQYHTLTERQGRRLTVYPHSAQLPGRLKDSIVPTSLELICAQGNAKSLQEEGGRTHSLKPKKRRKNKELLVVSHIKK